MARKQKNTVDYFPHAVRHGKKMKYIENKYGNDGYATWFKVLEELGSSDNHYLDLDDEITLMFLSDRCMIEEITVLEIVADLVKLKEFDADLWNENKIIWCDKYSASITDAYRKRAADCPTKDTLIQLLRSKGRLKGGINTQSKVKKIKEEKIRVDQSRENKIKEKKNKEKDFVISDDLELEDFLKINAISETEYSAGELIGYLNEIAGLSIPQNSIPVKKIIMEILEDEITDHDAEMIKNVIELKTKESQNGKFRREWLDPSTLFRTEKFRKYAQSVRDFKNNIIDINGLGPSEVDKRRARVERLTRNGRR